MGIICNLELYAWMRQRALESGQGPLKIRYSSRVSPQPRASAIASTAEADHRPKAEQAGREERE
jgi:hypothetical protein